MTTSDTLNPRQHFSIKSLQREEIPWSERRKAEQESQKAQAQQFQMWVKKSNPPVKHQAQPVSRHGFNRR